MVSVRRRSTASALLGALRKRVTLVASIQSKPAAITTKINAPVGDQNPSLAQVVLRSANKAATARPAPLNHWGTA